jgi:hypothetical protein
VISAPKIEPEFSELTKESFMKTQLSRYLSIFYTIFVVFVFAAALSTATAGCGDEESNDAGDASAENAATAANGDNSTSTEGSHGSGDPSGTSEEEGTTTDSAGAGGDKTDDGTDGDETDVTVGTPFDGGGATDGGGTGDGGGIGVSNGDDTNDGTSGASDRVECTPDDLSECDDINITGGLVPMEACCTEDGFCGRNFTLPDGFNTGCLTGEFVDSPIVPECEDCARSSCQQEVSACHNDSDCTTISDCLLSCTDVMSCAECVMNNSAGLTNYGSLALCAVSECDVCVEQFGRLLPPELVDAIQNAGIAGGGMPGGGMPGGGF